MIKITRRHFLKYTLQGSTAFILGVNLSQNKSVYASQNESANNFSPSIWLKLDQDNICTIIVPETEMGQGVYTGIATLVAEELDLDWKQVNVVRADSSEIYGYQLTGGSTSIRNAWLKFREAGAIARKIFVLAAAKKWNVKPEKCYTQSGAVYLSGGSRNISYAELISDANQIEIPENVELKDPKDFKLIGKDNPRLDDHEKVTGQAVFGIDVQLPNLIIATTVHAPVFGSTINKIQPLNNSDFPGLIKIINLKTLVAVVANDFWTAHKVAKSLKIDWDIPSNLSDDMKISHALQQALKTEGELAQEHGEKLVHKDNKSVSAEYSVPFQAHATMEPMNCTVYIHDGICEIWAPTQSPSNAKSTAKLYFHTKYSKMWKKLKSIFSDSISEDIIVHTTYVGGGFGRRLKQDFVAEAVQIALHFDVPLKLIWSREEDIQHDRYRPIALSKLEASLDENGFPVSFQHHIVSPSLRDSLSPGYINQKRKIDSTAIEGALRLPYEINYHKLSYSHISNKIPLGYWRSVGASINAYLIESFIDELAHHANKDPYKYRATLLQFNPRLLNTLNTVKDISNWKQNSNSYYGIACHSSYGSHVSLVAEITSENGIMTLNHVYCAIDCGMTLNPDIIKAQMESSIIFGLSSLFHEINIKDGRVVQSNFHDYPIIRYDQSPNITCHVIENTQEPGGVGEAGVPPTLPAITNAIFAATGNRIRKLPIKSSLFSTK